jgi:ribosomal protein L16 Arg81 hydroxylase
MTFDRFASLIHPVTVKDFFETIDGRTSKHIPGVENRHEMLFGWDDLNQFLNKNLRHLQPPILRLALRGEIIPPREICDEGTTLRRGTFLRFSKSKIEQKIAEGATLIINGIDDYDERLSNLRDDLNLELGERVQINVYFSPGGIGGFQPHYDTHDVLVLQVEGRKTWNLYGETHPVPLESQPSADQECPTNDPEIRQLTSGDILYVPRGHWHSALADSGPSLHLTIGVYHRTRIDLLAWMLEQAKDSAVMRQNADSPFAQDRLRISFEEIQNVLQRKADDLNNLQVEFQNYRDKQIQGESSFIFPKV